jgi:hypothetical protein
MGRMKNKARQLVFVDDSGDPGFKGAASSHFVVACTIFMDDLVAEEVALTMRKYRRSIGWDDEREFKFTKMKKDYIKELLRRVSKFDFEIYAVVVDKSKTKAMGSKNFYNAVISELFTRTPLKNASIRIDGHGGTNYIKAATAFFRKNTNIKERKIVEVRYADSRENMLIQLADLIASSIFHSTQVKKLDHADYLKIIKKRIGIIHKYEQ